jgi:hypothetical protein
MGCFLSWCVKRQEDSLNNNIKKNDNNFLSDTDKKKLIFDNKDNKA